jgi:hypothetical protein
MRTIPFTDSRNGVFVTSADAHGGMGGLAGMKNDGTEMMVACANNQLNTYNKVDENKGDLAYYH